VRYPFQGKLPMKPEGSQGLPLYAGAFEESLGVSGDIKEVRRFQVGIAGLGVRLDGGHVYLYLHGKVREVR